MTEVKVKNWGNSLGLIIPKDIVKHENLHDGDTIKVDIVRSKQMDGFGMFKGLPKFQEEKEPHEDLW